MIRRFQSMVISAVILSTALSASALGVGREMPVFDFETGLNGWQTNDAGKYERRTPEATLVTVSISDAAHSGHKSLQITFHPGDDWANAYAVTEQLGPIWAASSVDEIRFWMKGDGSDKQVRICLHAWSDGSPNPLVYEVPVSLKETDWHEVRISLSEFQASTPEYQLRLKGLINFQVNGDGKLGPARLWIDDVRVANARGEGARYAGGPYDKQIAELPSADSLPRIGNWGIPSLSPDILRQCRQMGLQFGSNNEQALKQQKAFLSGITTNHCPPRPSSEDLIAGLGLTDEDMDQDAYGNRMGEGVQSSVFHQTVIDRFVRSVSDNVKSRKDSPWVSSFMLSSPVSMYGETHYSASTVGQYAVFSRPAKQNFRRWLKRQYNNDLSAVARAWGQSLKSWDDVLPPAEGPKAVSDGIDTRTWWSDFIHWYNWWLDDVTRRSISASRKETDKPIAVMIGGPKVGLGQGISLGNIGSTIRILGKNRPAFVDDTDSQTLFSVRYSRAACSQYGANLMVENVGPPFLQIFHHYNMFLNILAAGADNAHLSHLNELFDDKHWMSQVWKSQGPVVNRYRTGYLKSDAAMFHSYMTSWYRPDRSNGDTVTLYDATNTGWTPDRGYPSWGRALGSPDVVDDAMVEDGGLADRKLLVIPNSSVTVTSRKAVEAIRKWVRAGGTIVGFGPGCLAYTVETDRSLSHTPGMAGLLPAEQVKALAQTVGRSDVPAFVERKVGKGRAVMYIDPADVALKTRSGKSFVHEAMNALTNEAERAGVRFWCKADPDYDANLMYGGKDKLSGHHLFVADFTQYVRNGLRDAIFWSNRTFDFTFDPSLTGDAELVTITDSFENCQGGEAEYDPESHILTVRFRLPGKLSLTMGKNRNGLSTAKHPMMYWDNNDLVLNPAGVWDVMQTQEPIIINQDGSLNPSDAGMPVLIHGDMHREARGRGPTFRLSLSEPGSVIVHVNSVPNSAPPGKPSGAVLVAFIDGREVLRQELPDKDNIGHNLTGEYDQDFAVEVPAGEHEVRIDNQGGDWFSVDRYVFRGLR
ncbi:MAG: carbohydrate binding domain-containing protein [Armatimonadota bacterium]